MSLGEDSHQSEGDDLREYSEELIAMKSDGTKLISQHKDWESCCNAAWVHRQRFETMREVTTELIQNGKLCKQVDGQDRKDAASALEETRKRANEAIINRHISERELEMDISRFEENMESLIELAPSREKEVRESLTDAVELIADHRRMTINKEAVK